MISNKNNEVIGSIVPWALPMEVIPIHIEWTNDIIYDEIQIKIPDDFKFVDFLNVEDVKKLDNLAIVNRAIKSPLLEIPTYFGFLISSIRIHDELKIAKKISVEFLYKKEIIKSLSLYAKIFRPSIKATGEIDRIILTNDTENVVLPIHLKYSGFGDIRLNISAKIGGIIVSQGGSIIHELIRRLWLLETDDPDKIIIDESKKDITVDESFLQKIINDLEEKIESGNIDMSELLDDTQIKNFNSWLSNVKNSEKLLEVIHGHVEDLLLDILSDILGRHPTENVKLTRAQTRIRTKIRLPVSVIKIILKYTDVINNEYPLVEIPISIEDKRDQKTNTIIEIPIMIEKWEEEPFMNVAEMMIEEF